MDPNATLAAMRDARVRLAAAPFSSDEFFYAAQDLLEMSAALDERITSGGFLPDAWQNRA